MCALGPHQGCQVGGKKDWGGLGCFQMTGMRVARLSMCLSVNNAESRPGALPPHLRCEAYPVRRRVRGSSRPPSWPEEEAACSSCTQWTTSSGDLE